MRSIQILLILLCGYNTANAQFWKQALKVVANPTGWATAEAARKLTGNNTIPNVINPTSVIIDNTTSGVSKTRHLIQDAIRQGDWYSLLIFTNPCMSRHLAPQSQPNNLAS